MHRDGRKRDERGRAFLRAAAAIVAISVIALSLLSPRAARAEPAEPVDPVAADADASAVAEIEPTAEPAAPARPERPAPPAPIGTRFPEPLEGKRVRIGYQFKRSKSQGLLLADRDAHPGYVRDRFIPYTETPRALEITAHVIEVA